MKREASLLTGPPLLEMVAGGRVLARVLTVDTGILVPALHWWAGEPQPHGDTRPAWTISKSLGGSTIVRVPAGFRYDGASIPVWLQVVSGEKDLYEIAAGLHDWLYTLQAPRESADLVFWQVARSAPGIGSVRGFLSWSALRAAGWYAYSQHAPVEGA